MDMVERVAEALEAAAGEWGSHYGERAEDIPYPVLATAAIKAMMEPDMAMLNAAVDATGAGSDMTWSNRSPQGMFETGYRAMIAAIGREVGDGNAR